MFVGNVDEELKINRIEMMIVAAACERLSPELLEAEIDTFFYDFLNEDNYVYSIIDLSTIPPEHAEAFFRGFSTATYHTGLRFGFSSFDRLSDYKSKLLLVDHSSLKSFSRHLLTQLHVDDLPVELRDIKLGADLGL